MRSGKPYEDGFTFLEGMERYGATIGSDRAFLLKNVDFFRSLATTRDGIIKIGDNAGSGAVTGFGVIKKETGDILVRVRGTKFQKLVSNAWTDVATVTAGYAAIESFTGPDMTAAPATTGTVTASTSRSIAATGFTGNVIGKYYVQTSGAGAGQTKLITAATSSEIFIEGIFDILPANTDTFAIRNRADHVYVSNGIDDFFMYDGTTKTDFPSTKKFHYLRSNNNRLYGARNDEDIVYFSDLATGYFANDNTIPIDQDGDSIAGMRMNQEKLIVYKNYSRFKLSGGSPELFTLQRMESNKGAIAPLSIVDGNNLQFFLSDEGIEMFNMLEQSSLDEGLSLSLMIRDMIDSHTTQEKKEAIAFIDDNKLHMQIGTNVYVYHIAHSDISKSNIWSVYQYPGKIEYAVRVQGKVYMAIAGIIYTIGGTTDDGAPINVEFITNRRTQSGKDGYRQNKLYLRTYFEFDRPSVSTPVTFSMAHNGSTLVQKKIVDIRDKPLCKVDYAHRANDIQIGFSFSTSEKIRFIHGQIDFNIATHN